ncbi:MAG: hypothetical protein Q8934_23745 [Bacillota bacterium]|nr:hypothetical protein [Bacillota bacterium]
MKKRLMFYSIILIIFIGAVMNLRDNKVQESITYFPIDPKVSFKAAETTLTILNQTKSDQYTLQWNVSSILDRKAYLRQDVGFLFSNGKLIGKLGRWRENTKNLEQKKNVTEKESAFIQALTFHYAELHENENKIFSAQTMSRDQLYVILTPSRPLFTFRTAQSKEEAEWKEQRDQKTEQFLKKSWNKGIQVNSINLKKYHLYPLTQFYFKPQETIAGFSEEQTNRIVGSLWEGLYKNYFLGIKKADGTIVNPIGRTIPLILLAKDKTHLLVLTETENGEPIILRQMLGYVH